ncbi:hypothetical protein KIMH_03820 [Bombiscardovia apis]|uniref:Uncharacterized protein n=1 Tax=Bombiscardovia apis TaxID=2932182 RepID=A0ABN6SG97_9BIFI|nr:hypothetical protein KIMH_03820 [Bombiscardovia apis]
MAKYMHGATMTTVMNSSIKVTDNSGSEILLNGLDLHQSWVFPAQLESPASALWDSFPWPLEMMESFMNGVQTEMVKSEMALQAFIFM